MVSYKKDEATPVHPRILWPCVNKGSKFLVITLLSTGLSGPDVYCMGCHMTPSMNLQARTA